ncbi:MAG TPA: sigma-54-dependent Fis family transcriptional regulator [Candidatus Binatia bacterium]|nr:sigma-54-dependent Fis family transcriptional regulator [Candidatus Binatia bacterium]
MALTEQPALGSSADGQSRPAPTARPAPPVAAGRADPEPVAADSERVARLERERDLYLALLRLGQCEDVERFVEDALALVTQAVGAHQGYLELRDGEDGCRWWTAHRFTADDVASVRRTISTGIIALALESGETVVTRSASRDERFERRSSVRDARIEAVLCAPIGCNPAIGVLYLQRRIEPEPFSEDDRRKVEVCARHLAPYAERLIARSLASAHQDRTQPFRDRLRVEGVIGRSAALANVLREVALVAPLDVDVLLTGPSGTGKSQIARIIHDNSARAGRPFVELNCAAIPESLIESELFGAFPGAHSTASRRMDGKLAGAQGGTLLLDEIGELSLSAQAKLLQLQQSHVYYPLGSTRPVQADLRIVAATNVDLESAVREGRFREDLYYRLALLPIRLPTLAERREDIAELASHFCAVACTRHRLPTLTLSPQLVSALAAAEWPGNVRQLLHAVEAAAIRAAAAGVLQVETAHVFSPTDAVARDARPWGDGNGPASLAGLTFQEATRRFQAQLLRATLEATNWHVGETARRLEVARSHVYALIRGFELERPR